MRAAITCPISYSMNRGVTLTETKKADEIIKEILSMKRLIVMDLDEEPLEKNKEFLKGLYGLKIPKEIKEFDKLNCNVSFSRQDDKKMTLEKYLKKMDDSPRMSISLSAGWQDDPRIIYSISMNDKEDKETSRFAWYKCQLNKPNYKKVSTLFEKVYGKA